jgi:CheY-like chemotaxis protein
MNKDIVILVVQDDDGHFRLTETNLRRAGMWNEIIRFRDGQELLSFLLGSGPGPKRRPQTKYLLMLDLRLPNVDGVEVLKQIKQNEQLRRLPVVILTMMDDAEQVALCYSLGCSIFVTEPVDYDSFVDAVQRLGSFLSAVSVPQIS